MTCFFSSTVKNGQANTAESIEAFMSCAKPLIMAPASKNTPNQQIPAITAGTIISPSVGKGAVFSSPYANATPKIVSPPKPIHPKILLRVLTKSRLDAIL